MPWKASSVMEERLRFVARRGRLCLHRKRINISSVLAGQRLGIKEVDEGIWLASFMHYDLGYFDLEQKTLQPLTTRSARGRHPCLRYDLSPMCPGWTRRTLERAKGFEPSTPTLARSCSTPELHPRPNSGRARRPDERAPMPKGRNLCNHLARPLHLRAVPLVASTPALHETRGITCPGRDAARAAARRCARDTHHLRRDQAEFRPSSN